MPGSRPATADGNGDMDARELLDLVTGLYPFMPPELGLTASHKLSEFADEHGILSWVNFQEAVHALEEFAIAHPDSASWSPVHSRPLGGHRLRTVGKLVLLGRNLRSSRSSFFSGHLLDAHARSDRASQRPSHAEGYLERVPFVRHFSRLGQLFHIADLTKACPQSSSESHCQSQAHSKVLTQATAMPKSLLHGHRHCQQEYSTALQSLREDGSAGFPCLGEGPSVNGGVGAEAAGLGYGGGCRPSADSKVDAGSGACLELLPLSSGGAEASEASVPGDSALGDGAPGDGGAGDRAAGGGGSGSMGPRDSLVGGQATEARLKLPHAKVDATADETRRSRASSVALAALGRPRNKTFQHGPHPCSALTDMLPSGVQPRLGQQGGRYSGRGCGPTMTPPPLGLATGGGAPLDSLQASMEECARMTQHCQQMMAAQQNLSAALLATAQHLQQVQHETQQVQHETQQQQPVVPGQLRKRQVSSAQRSSYV